MGGYDGGTVSTQAAPTQTLLLLPSLSSEHVPVSILLHVNPPHSSSSAHVCVSFLIHAILRPCPSSDPNSRLHRTHPGELSIGRRRTATCSAVSVAAWLSAARGIIGASAPGPSALARSLLRGVSSGGGRRCVLLALRGVSCVRDGELVDAGCVRALRGVTCPTDCAGGMGNGMACELRWGVQA
jgi:hypothetical protein